MSASAPPRPRALLFCGLVLSACVAFWAATGDQTAQVPRHLLVWSCAGLAYLLALRASRGLGPRALAAALALAALWRVALVPAAPLLSDDVYRSVWEGRIQLHGGNPYAWADRPEAERWRPLRDGTWERMNHRGYTAVYPPLWQLTTRALAAVWDSPAAVKALLAACEGLALLGLATLLERRGLPRERLLVWAWSPLALVEVAGGGHNDAFGLLFVVLALLALERGRAAPAAWLLALGAQAKLLPALFGVACLRRFRVWHVASAAFVAALLVWPFSGAGPGLVRSLVAYGSFWRFNETLIGLLLAVTRSQLAASLAALALLACLAALLALRGGDLVPSGLLLTAAWLLLAANVLPWYALWLLPWLVLRDAGWALAFTLSCGLAYLVYPQYLAGGPWQVPVAVRALEYGAPALVAALACARARRPPAVSAAA